MHVYRSMSLYDITLRVQAQWPPEKTFLSATFEASQNKHLNSGEAASEDTPAYGVVNSYITLSKDQKKLINVGKHLASSIYHLA